MVIQFSQALFKPKGNGRPLLNEFTQYNVPSASRLSATSVQQKRRFWRWFKSKPELNSPIQIRVDDTITDIDFCSIDGTPLGRNTRLQAEKIYEDNFLQERFKSMQYDRLVTGSGFLWYGGLTSSEESMREVKAICKNIAKSMGLSDAKVREVGDKLFLRAIDEDVRRIRKIDYVPSSTMLIDHDDYDVIRYIQRVGTTDEYFNPDEIVHIPLTRADGKVEGWTPVESLTAELFLLYAIKENMMSYIKNGGSANKLYILADEIANSSNHEYLQQVLSNKGLLRNRHGNLVLTGNVEVVDLEKNPKDLEYKELMLLVTSNIAYGLRVPVSRIPYLIGTAQSKGDAGGMAESGYWSMINSDQQAIEQHLNSQIFSKLKFKIKFKRQYKIDSLREAQAMNFRVDAAIKMNDVLSNMGYQMKKEKMISLLSGNTSELSDSDVEEKQMDDTMMLLQQKQIATGNSFAPDNQVNREPDKINMDNTKRQAGQNNPSSSNQSGY